METCPALKKIITRSHLQKLSSIECFTRIAQQFEHSFDEELTNSIEKSNEFLDNLNINIIEPTQHFKGTPIQSMDTCEDSETANSKMKIETRPRNSLKLSLFSSDLYIKRRKKKTQQQIDDEEKEETPGSKKKLSSAFLSEFQKRRSEKKISFITNSSQIS